jgi:MFS family permease
MTSRIPNLLRERSFKGYWLASIVSSLGDGVSSIAVPLVAAITLQANPIQIGYLTALAWLPGLILSIPLGMWVDRINHIRGVLIFSDIFRFLLVGAIALCHETGTLTLGLLYILIAAKGALSAVFEVGNAALFGTLVRPNQYVTAQSLLVGGQQFSSLAGPSIAGFLVKALTAPVAVAVDAASYLLSAIFLRNVRRARKPTAPEMSRPLGDGLRFIRKNSDIRRILLATSSINLFATFTNALVIIYIAQQLEMGADFIGIYYGMFAVGGLVGAVSVNWLVIRFSTGHAFIIGGLLYCVPDLLVPMTSNSGAVAMTILLAQAFVSGVGVAIENVAVGSMFTSIVPEKIRATVRGVFQTISFGMRPIGAIVSGAIGLHYGVESALWIGALGATLSFLWIIPFSIPLTKNRSFSHRRVENGY